RQRDGHGFDASEVFSGSIEVEQLFRQSETATSCGAQLHKRQRINLQEAYMLRQLIFPLIQVMVGHLHGLNVEEQLLAGQESLSSVEVVELDVGQGWIAQLVLQREFGFLRSVKGKMESFG